MGSAFQASTSYGTITAAPVTCADACRAIHHLGEDMFGEKTVNLKTVAAHVGLAPCSVSAILNNTAASRAIPQRTRDRVYRAARELNYRPNHWARSLRTRQTRMVAVLAPGLGRPAVAHVVSAMQETLHRHGYLLVLIGSDSEDGSRLSAHLQQRGIEGVISIDGILPGQLGLPVVPVDVGVAVSSDSVDPTMRGWLAELGDSAAENVIRVIENPGVAHRTQVAVSVAAPLFEAQSSNFEFGASAESA